jgi:hypothetical protein
MKVPVRPRKAFRKACGYGVAAENIDNWRFQLDLANNFDRGTLRHNKINGQTLKVARKFGHAFDSVIAVAKFNR